MNKTLVLLFTCFSFGAHSATAPKDEIIKGIRYGIAWKIYWDTALNTWEKDHSLSDYAASDELRNLRGKEISVTTRKREVAGDGIDCKYYLERV